MHTVIIVISFKKTYSEKIKLINYKLTLVPCVLETRVFPMFLTLKIEGTLMLYKSFFTKESIIRKIGQIKTILRDKKKKNKKRVDFSMHLLLVSLLSIRDLLKGLEIERKRLEIRIERV